MPTSRQPGTPRPRTANQASRLSGGSAFEAVFRNGTRREGRYVQIISTPAGRPTGRVGFVISGKVLPRAVDRNRLKRLLREFLRAHRPALTAFDLVIRLKRALSRERLGDAAGEAAALIHDSIRTTRGPASDRR